MDYTPQISIIRKHVATWSEPFVTQLKEAEYGKNCFVLHHVTSLSLINDTKVLFVNKDGNFFRVIQQSNGRWQLVKTWNGLFESLGWMQTSLEREDPLAVIRMASGRSGSPLRLCLLPRHANSGPRMACFEGKLFKAHFNQVANTFTLVNRNGGEKTFVGKLWESSDAVAWCAANDGMVPMTTDSDEVTVTCDHDEPVALTTAHIPNFAAQEDHPLWGSF